MLVYACVSVCGVLCCQGGRYGPHQPGVLLGSASSASPGTLEDRASERGLLGMGCIFLLSLGTPRKRVGAISSLKLRVRGIAQAVRAHLAPVLGPLGLSDPMAHPLPLRACGQGGVSALPTP